MRCIICDISSLGLSNYQSDLEENFYFLNIEINGVMHYICNKCEDTYRELVSDYNLDDEVDQKHDL